MSTTPTTLPRFDRDYFIAKFEAIPDEKWCEGRLTDDDGRSCALGHCDGRGYQFSHSPEALALNAFFPTPAAGKLTIASINDGLDSRYQQPTPKARILAALRALPA